VWLSRAAELKEGQNERQNEYFKRRKKYFLRLKNLKLLSQMKLNKKL
jgi:hypothetical protein